MDAQENRIYISIIITSIILAIIIIYFLVSVIRQQRKILKLHRQNIIAEVTAQEKERSRIASDLHDELGPMVTSVKMKINSFILTDEQDQRQLEKTNEHLDKLVHRMREISFDLMPEALLRKGLLTALKQFIHNTGSAGLSVQLATETEELNLSEQKAINVYRIIQEVIQNTYKHANATRLLIELKQEPGKLILRSTDNGAGFNYEKEVKENIGFGLRNLLSRVEIMGGELFVDSEHGKGTTYTFEIPT
jgi:two-component system, NarL family, sensor kinase